MLNDIAGVELEGIGFSRAFGKHDGGVERTQAAGRTVRDKMNVGKLFRIAGEVGRRSRLCALVNLFLRCGEMSGDICHLLAGARQFGIFLAGSDAVADEEQIRRVSVSRTVRMAILSGERRREHAQRTGVRHVGIFDPEVGLGVGDDQGLEIQVVEAAVGNDEDLRVVRAELLRAQ